jgi:preprotein translocase subunit SecA
LLQVIIGGNMSASINFSPWQEINKTGKLKADLPLSAFGGIVRQAEAVVNGFYNQRVLAGFAPALYEQMIALNSLSDLELSEKLLQIRRRILYEKGHENRALVAGGLAILGNACSRRLGKTPYPQQLAVSAGLCRGWLLEMATGEGKTISLAMAAALLAFSGKPLHIITANDYLAARDAAEMAALYNFCGLSVGAVTGLMDTGARKKAYESDVVYTTAKELAADFLRDRLFYGSLQNGERRLLRYLLRGRNANADGAVLNGIHKVLVDEADHLLIDEAATPLIISSSGSDSLLEEAVPVIMQQANRLKAGSDYVVQSLTHGIKLSPAALNNFHREIELMMAANKSDGAKRLLQNHDFRQELLLQALRARHFFRRDQHYLVKENEKGVAEIKIIDQGTGRILPGRSWNQGLQQMIEFKEGVPFSPRQNSVAGISFQNFFRQVPFLAGVSGTVMENRREFQQVYSLSALRVPTHKPCRRIYHRPVYFADRKQKYQSALELLIRLHEQKRPVLVATASVRESAAFAELLQQQGLGFNLLNAGNDLQEARIIAGAGASSAITIATNMAGRGTDIVPDKQALKSGGLCVISLEKNLSRRVDRQLYGRCARQGESGEVFCFFSLDEDLFQHFVPHFLQRLLIIMLQFPLCLHWLIYLCCSLSAFWGSRRYEKQARRARLSVMQRDRWLKDYF